MFRVFPRIALNRRKGDVGRALRAPSPPLGAAKGGPRLGMVRPP